MSRTNRRVLLVAYHFPPFGGSGVQRALKLARYLPDAGWYVHVLTAAHRHYPLIDDTLLSEVGDNIRVHRVRGWEPGALAASTCGWLNRCDKPSMLENRVFWRLERLYRRLGLHDPEALWVTAAIRAARRIIRMHDIDAIVTTSPPHCVQRVGLAIHRRLGIPWIADLRDPILDNFALDAETERAVKPIAHLESSLVSKATRLVVTCADLADALRERHGADADPRILTNGFDPADAPPPMPAATGHRFTLAHVGAFYKAQTIEPLLCAVRSMLVRRPEFASRFELRIVGSVSAEQRQLLRATDDAFLRLTGYRTHRESVAEMAAADALFLMTPANRGGRYCIPAKTFEYVAFGGKVIAMIHPGSALQQLLEQAGEVVTVGQAETEGLSHAIEASVVAWQQGQRSPARDPSVLHPYRRDVIAGRYAALLDECVRVPTALDPHAPAQEAA